METTVTVSDCLLASGAGFLLGAYYEIFRLWRLWMRSGKWGVFWQDILFFTTSAGAFFLFALAVSDGQIRALLLAGCVVGFCAWRATVGRLLFTVTRRSLRILHRLKRKWSNRLEKAEQQVQKILAKPMIFFKKRLHNAILMLYNQHKNRNLAALPPQKGGDEQNEDYYGQRRS